VLFFWRKTVVTRFNQSDFTNVKASEDQADLALSEVIRLAQLFQEQGMFQNIDALAKEFVVERNASDRSRFDVFTPVNVIPILAVIATNIQGTTAGDTLTI
jgi:phage tail sheath gpL-like